MMKVLINNWTITTFCHFFTICLLWYICYHCYSIHDNFMKNMEYQEKKIAEVQKSINDTYLFKEFCLGGDDERIDTIHSYFKGICCINFMKNFEKNFF